MIYRIYISGPITDNPNYYEDFERAEKTLTIWNSGYELGDGIEIEFINPARVSDSMPASFDYEDYMDVDMLLLTKCDAIYMIRGYEKSRGALAELLMAKNMGLEIFYESEELKDGRKTNVCKDNNR